LALTASIPLRAADFVVYASGVAIGSGSHRRCRLDRRVLVLDRLLPRSHGDQKQNAEAAANGGQGSRRRAISLTGGKGRGMKRIVAALGCSLALAFLLVASVSAGSSGVTVATGSFTLVGDAGSHRTFSFAVVDRDGQITGDAAFITFAGDAISIDINCFTVVGNQAIIGGTVRSSTNPDLVGVSVAFAIQDNPDAATFVVLDDAIDVTCANLLEYTGEANITGALNDFGVPIEQGNVVIRHAN
jgi:hypothetical protein